MEIGLNKGYTAGTISIPELIGFLKGYQKSRIAESEVYLSVSVSDSLIVLNEHTEPHARIGFINYPRFPMTHETFKTEVEKCASYLMEKMEQNRIVIAFNDETIMLEKNSQVDPGVLKL